MGKEKDTVTSRDYSPEAVKERLGTWLVGGGVAELQRVVQEAVQERKSYRDAFRVKPETLDKPVTM